jgi:hypothetical protein
MAKGIMRKLDIVTKNVNKAISAQARSDCSKYAAALSSEGYLGGYRQAIYDVILALNGCEPRTRNFWIKDAEWVD